MIRGRASGRGGKIARSATGRGAFGRSRRWAPQGGSERRKPVSAFADEARKRAIDAKLRSIDESRFGARNPFTFHECAVKATLAEPIRRSDFRKERARAGEATEASEVGSIQGRTNERNLRDRPRNQKSSHSRKKTPTRRDGSSRRSVWSVVKTRHAPCARTQREIATFDARGNRAKRGCELLTVFVAVIGRTNLGSYS